MIEIKFEIRFDPEIESISPSAFEGILPYIVLTIPKGLVDHSYVREIEAALKEVEGIEVIWSYRADEDIERQMKIYVHDDRAKGAATALVSPLLKILSTKRALQSVCEEWSVTSAINGLT